MLIPKPINRLCYNQTYLNKGGGMFPFFSGSKYIIYGLGALLVVGFIFKQGYSYGYDTVKEQWDKEKQATTKLMLNLKDKYNEQAKEFKEKEMELVLDFKEKEQNFTNQLAAINASYDLRMYESEQRASIYQHMSRASESKQKALADYTARLDRALTEGRELVKELRTIIELRDNQLRTVHEQLKLMEATTNE